MIYTISATIPMSVTMKLSCLATKRCLKEDDVLSVNSSLTTCFILIDVTKSPIGLIIPMATVRITYMIGIYPSATSNTSIFPTICRIDKTIHVVFQHFTLKRTTLVSFSMNKFVSCYPKSIFMFINYKKITN